MAGVGAARLSAARSFGERLKLLYRWRRLSAAPLTFTASEGTDMFKYLMIAVSLTGAATFAANLAAEDGIAVSLTCVELSPQALERLGLDSGRQLPPILSMADALSLLDPEQARVLSAATVVVQPGFEGEVRHGGAQVGAAPKDGGLVKTEDVPGRSVYLKVRAAPVAGGVIDLDGEYSFTTISAPEAPGRKPTVTTVSGRPRAVLRSGEARVIATGTPGVGGFVRVVLLSASSR